MSTWTWLRPERTGGGKRPPPTTAPDLKRRPAGAMDGDSYENQAPDTPRPTAEQVRPLGVGNPPAGDPPAEAIPAAVRVGKGVPLTETDEYKAAVDAAIAIMRDLRVLAADGTAAAGRLKPQFDTMYAFFDLIKTREGS